MDDSTPRTVWMIQGWPPRGSGGSRYRAPVRPPCRYGWRGRGQSMNPHTGPAGPQETTSMVICDHYAFIQAGYTIYGVGTTEDEARQDALDWLPPGEEISRQAMVD